MSVFRLKKDHFQQQNYLRKKLTLIRDPTPANGKYGPSTKLMLSGTVLTQERPKNLVREPEKNTRALYSPAWHYMNILRSCLLNPGIVIKKIP